jgi:glucosaminylphosphatidylinositol acyltransferase
MTIAAERPFLLSLALVMPALGLLLILPQRPPELVLLPQSSPTTSRAASPSSDMTPAKSATNHIPSAILAPLPALTIYRAHMLLMTILAILAVDFSVFPRSFAKCETFGVSLVSSLLT